MSNRFAALAIVTALLSGCGGGSPLSAEEREWCSFADDSRETALRYDVIALAGADAGINMELVSIFAGELRATYEAEGMAANEAIAAVSDALLDNEDFIAACQAAYAQHVDAGDD